MSHRRRVRVAVATFLAAAGAAIFLAIGVGGATATTGSTPLAFPPRYKVRHADARPFLGRFKLSAPHSTNLVSGAYVAGYNELGFVEGSLAIYHYGEGGREEAWVATTYEYRKVGNKMLIDVISPDNQVIFGRLALVAGKNGVLRGTLFQRLPKQAPRAVTFRSTPAPR